MQAEKFNWVFHFRDVFFHYCCVEMCMIGAKKKKGILFFSSWLSSVCQSIYFFFLLLFITDKTILIRNSVLCLSLFMCVWFLHNDVVHDGCVLYANNKKWKGLCYKIFVFACLSLVLIYCYIFITVC